MRFRILGPLEVWEDGHELQLGTGRQRALLALLLVHANEVVSTDRLIDELWDERPPATAAKVVQGYVSHLRKALPDDVLVTRPTGYLLHVGETDASEFERLVDKAHAQEPADAARTLRRALDLWRGPPLADVEYETWAQAEVGRLQELRLAALEDRIDAELQLGRHAILVPELEQFVAEHPLRERLRGQLMLALYRSGRQVEALDAYADARRRLVDELGIEPGPELSDLQRRILTHDPELGSAARPLPLIARRRPLALLLAGAVLVIGAAAAAIAELNGSSDGIASLPPSSVGVIDTSSRRIVAKIAITGGPSRLASDGRSVWVGSDDSGTASAINARTRRPTSVLATGGFPSELATSDGAVWVVDGKSGLLRKLDPVYGPLATVRVTASNAAYDGSRENLDPLSVAADAASVWVTDGSRKLIRVDPARARIVQRVDLRQPLDDVTLGDRAIWTISGAAATLFRLNRRTGAVTARIPIVSSPGFASPYPIAVRVGEGSVWVLDGNTATVTKIDPEQRTVLATIAVGIEHGPTRLAVGDGAAWVANGDGTLARIDASTDAVAIIPVGHRLKDVAVVDGTVWVTVGAGLSGSEAPAASVSGGPVRALPTSSCSPIYYEGGGRPQYLIASDLPLQGVDRTVSAQAGQAVEFVLGQHRFRAGRYAVGYQSCDDSTVQLGYPSPARCAANAHAYANDKSVIGVIGAWSSRCSQGEVPIANRAPDGSLAMISPSNTYVGLTHSGPGTAPDEPGRYYPTGTRNYVRIIAADDFQGAADALLAKQLGVRRVYLLNDGEPYGNGIAADFHSAAARLGVRIVGSATYPSASSPSFTSLVNRARAARADAVFLGLFGAYPDTGRLIKELRAGLGAGVRLIAPDSFAVFGQLVSVAGAAAEGMMVSAPGLPTEQLPKAGKTFVAAFGRTVGQTPFQPSVYWAEAAQVLLDAIARSDGTRASVRSNLFKTKVANGILGSFSIDANGDTTAAAVTIYRVVQGAPMILRVVTPPRSLVH